MAMCKNTVIFLLMSVHVYYSRSLGDRTNYNFSLCWLMNTNAASTSRPKISVWLNEAELMSIGKFGKFNSLTVQTSEQHSLKLQYGDIARTWTFSVSDGSNTIEIQSAHSSVEATPNQIVLDALKVFSPEQMYACEKDPLYLHQSEDFILMLGHTTRFPLKLESHSSSMLLVSWRDAGDPGHPLPLPRLHSVSMYHRELGAYAALGADTTASLYYRFSSLQGCMPYVACLELPASPSVTCLSTITDPDVPIRFQVTSWNSNQVTVDWKCPRNHKYSLFLLTLFHLNGTDHIVEERTHRHQQHPFIFTASNLPPCSRIRFGLQTVCDSGKDSRTSKMVMIDGNSAHSAIQSIHQSDAGPEDYTLSWSVMDISMITMFKVYHQGALHGSTLFTAHMVMGLAPCQCYQARVEAVCGESVVMNVKTLETYTGPRVVSDLRYRAEDSTALWSGPTSPDGAFSYNLTHENGSPVSSGSLPEPLLPLRDLSPGLTYVLEVWEECQGWGSPSRAVLCFDAQTVPKMDVRSGGIRGDGKMSDFLRSMSSVWSPLAVIVPWRPSADLNDPKSRPRVELERVVKNKIVELLKDFPHPVSVDVLTFEDYGSGTQTKLNAVLLSASVTDTTVPFSSAEVLEFIQSLSPVGVTVENGMVYWDDPDECSMLELNQCAPHSVCINTLDSYTCVCQDGYYDVSPLLNPTTACHENGLSTQCSQAFIRGSIAKAYLVDYFGGNVTMVLNDGRCPVLESETLYYFRASRNPGHCGTKIVVNRTHFEFINVVTVTASRERVIIRRDLKVFWKCVNPRHYLRNDEMKMHLEWISSYSLVEYNSSHILEVAMALYRDDSFTHNYTHAVSLLPEEFLYLEVALKAHNTFASDLLLEVVMCWATESQNPEDKTKGILLRDGCPVDLTFHWLSENGMAQMTRFSVQMFSMPAGLPFYIHCLTRVCAPDENCTTTCPAKMSSKVRRDLRHTPSAVVSAGPLLVGNISSAHSINSKWNEIVMLMTVLGGSIGLLVFTLLVVTATKTLLNLYGRVQ